MINPVNTQFVVVCDEVKSMLYREYAVVAAVILWFIPRQIDWHTENAPLECSSILGQRLAAICILGLFGGLICKQTTFGIGQRYAGIDAQRKLLIQAEKLWRSAAGNAFLFASVHLLFKWCFSFRLVRQWELAQNLCGFSTWRCAVLYLRFTPLFAFTETFLYCWQ